MTALLSELASCYECNKTFDEGLLVKCKSCAVFVCLNCIISCDLNKEYADTQASIYSSTKMTEILTAQTPVEKMAQSPIKDAGTMNLMTKGLISCKYYPKNDSVYM
jgi:hypothetical protein